MIERVADVLEAGRPADTDHYGSRTQYEERAFRIEGDLKEDIPLFSAANGIEHAVAEMLNVNLDRVHLLSGGAAQGLSGNAIYTVGERQAPSLLVKVFVEGRGEFGEELWALSTFSELELQHLRVPKVKALGRCVFNESAFLLLAEEFAPGELLSQRMASLRGKPVASTERSRQFAELILIQEKLGQGLAEIHTAGSGITDEMHPVISDYHKMMAEDAARRLKADPDLVELADAALAEFQRLMSRRTAKPYSYTHGDAHWGSYLYDEDADELWIIDVTDAGTSVATGRRPIGVPMFDYTRVITGFSFWQMLGGTDEETANLREAFDRGYRRVNPELDAIDSEEYQLFQLVNAFHFFHWYLKNRAVFPDDVVRHLDPFTDVYLSQIRKQLRSQ